MGYLMPTHTGQRGGTAVPSGLYCDTISESGFDEGGGERGVGMAVGVGEEEEEYPSLTAHQHQKGHTVPKQVETAL